MRNKASSLFISFSLCISVFLLCFSAYPQDLEKDVTLELRSKSQDIQMNGNLTIDLTVINNSRRNLFLVNPQKIRTGYDLTKRELGVGLDIQPTNNHFLEFPELRRLKPKGKINLNFSIPISEWGKLSSGTWEVDAYAGILDEEKLKKKLKDLGFSIKDDIQMGVMDFLALQSVFIQIPFQYISKTKMEMV